MHLRGCSIWPNGPAVAARRLLQIPSLNGTLLGRVTPTGPGDEGFHARSWDAARQRPIESECRLFERNLAGLVDDMAIMVSCQPNDSFPIRSRIDGSGRINQPTHTSARPGVEFVMWRRRNRFMRLPSAGAGRILVHLPPWGMARRCHSNRAVVTDIRGRK